MKLHEVLNVCLVPLFFFLHKVEAMSSLGKRGRDDALIPPALEVGENKKRVRKTDNAKKKGREKKQGQAKNPAMSPLHATAAAPTKPLDDPMHVVSIL